MTTLDWNYCDDYSQQAAVLETPHGIFRALLEHDDYPDAPDYDMGCPVYSYEYRWGVRMDDKPSTGSWSDDHSGIDFHAAVTHFYDRSQGFSEAIETLDRWLRVFHGGGVREISSSIWQGDPYYLVYETKAMREAWGQTGEMLDTSAPENADWQAFIDSDVWTATAQQACSFDEDGEPDDWTDIDGPVCGHFGEEWARDAAADMLKWAIEHAASEMLPIAN